MSEKEKIYLYSKLFRKAIEESEKKYLSPRFGPFPKGSCGEAADVLGTYLDELGFTPVYKVLKEWKVPEQSQTHAWLEYKDLLIDISADQFNNHPKLAKIFGFKEKVIVTKNDSNWYNVFEHNFGAPYRREAHYRLYDEFGNDRTARRIERDYLTILKYIPTEYCPQKENSV